MGGQLDGIFLAGSLPREFIILIVTLFICLWLINPSLSLCQLYRHIFARRSPLLCGVHVQRYKATVGARSGTALRRRATAADDVAFHCRRRPLRRHLHRSVTVLTSLSSATTP